MPPLLTAADILAADDIRSIEVEIPQWGGSVRVRGLSGKLRSQLEQKISSKANFGDIKMLVVLNCTIDEAGKPLFSNSQRPALEEKSADAIELIFEAACRLSGIGDKQVQEAEGNFATDLS